ncbi:monooxygenase [Nocardioides szechwanensis]|uniref:4-hydroxyacetophenone monooxygenase n=1 Tax=Nocardioides szechwanensis TaxID=1005944 RepID=A0A1H0J5M7_9ACTN|nr:NAD(P)/FAD-dependent oxidoreductase [Nocardioides szechwanensis]GEP35016.1 monooxygenase [Nocardioides szechwanensis]SDO39036.1 4-hydroxyacetophenone monooxygenase [Nocardioides szechwanensis]
MRSQQAGLRFDDSDDEIRAALEDVSIPTLLVSCVHMSGDASILDGPVRPGGAMLNEIQGYLSEEDKLAARELAFDVIRDYRDRGCPEPEPVDQSLVKKMMEFVVGAAVADEYVPMMLEELGLERLDTRADVSGNTGRVVPDDFSVVIIGCGMSGLLAAIRLGQAGIPYVVVEKNAGPGGTWYANTYPGARVDVGNHFYCYSFEPSDHWTEYFARQPEILEYFTAVMRKYGVDEHVRWSTEVTGATWDDETSTWVIDVGGPDGRETLRARALISAVGQLSTPHVPEVPGSFAGPAFHTARWDHGVDLTGKDVVMIGAGATGFQVAPAIADTVGSLTVLQRTAQWMFPNPGYHEPVGSGMQWALRHLPFYARWFRFLIFFPSCDAGLAAAKVDPAWEPQQTSVSEINDFARMMFTEWIESQLPDDPDLLAKVLPDYPATAKRTLQDNGSWLRTLTRDNVDLVRAGVRHLEADGVVDSEGTKHHADVLVWSTGFAYNEPLAPMTIRGRGGVDLREHWGTRPRAYLGVTVPSFPNFFCLYGPGTNLASGGSIIFASECEVRYTMACIEALLNGGHRTIEPKLSVYDDYYDRSQAEMRTMVWASPHIEHNYYQNDDGEVHGLNPWRLVDYWDWTRTVDLDDYQLQ